MCSGASAIPGNSGHNIPYVRSPRRCASRSTATLSSNGEAYGSMIPVSREFVWGAVILRLRITRSRYRSMTSKSLATAAFLVKIRTDQPSSVRIASRHCRPRSYFCASGAHASTIVHICTRPRCFNCLASRLIRDAESGSTTA